MIASSEKIAATRTNGKRPTRILIHGVDRKDFRNVRRRAPSEQIWDLPATMVAYFRLIDERCDLDFLAGLERALPDIAILILGPWWISDRPLAGRLNERIHSNVPNRELPASIARVPARILLHKVNELTDSVNPLKLKEHLADSIPVATTPLPEGRKLQPIVMNPSGTGEFWAEIEWILKEPAAGSEGFDEYLAQGTWAAKVEEFCSFVAEVLAERRRPSPDAVVAAGPVRDRFPAVPWPTRSAGRTGPTVEKAENRWGKDGAMR